MLLHNFKKHQRFFKANNEAVQLCHELNVFIDKVIWNLDLLLWENKTKKMYNNSSYEN